MASDTPFAAAIPTRRAPTRPGPTVTATPSMSPKPAETGRLERLGHERAQRLHVGARCHLRHHASEALVQVDLGRDEVGANGEAVLNHRDGGLVARGLDAEGDHAGRTPSGSSAAISARRAANSLDRTSSVHMISASSFSSW